MAKTNTSSFVYKLARAGAFSLGVVYAMIGIIALLSLMQLKNGGAGNAGVLNLIREIPFGNVLVAAIFLGLVAYVIWKFYNAVKDPYCYGSNPFGIIKRIGIAAAGLAYGLIAYTAAQALLGLTVDTHGEPTSQRHAIAQIFKWSMGEWIVGLLGVIVAVTGFAQFVYVIRKGYRDKVEFQKISKTKKHVITALVWIGSFARGIILLIIAFFLIKASIQSNPNDVVNTDKAFNFLGEQVGHFSFIAVAVGTICYGFYLFALSWYYDFQNDF